MEMDQIPRFNHVWEFIYGPAVRHTYEKRSQLPGGPSWLEYVTMDLTTFMALRSENAMDIAADGDADHSVIHVTPNLVAAMNRLEAGISADMPKARLRIHITIEDEEKPMANLYRVQDNSGERHVVAADTEHHAREVVAAYCKAVGAGSVDNAQVQYLGQADLVSSGAVLSGEDENVEKKTGTTPRK